MSGRSSAVMFICTVAIALAANKADDINYTSESTAGRTIASEIKNSFDVQPSILTHTEKIRGPVSNRIELVGQAPAKAGDTFILKGIFSSRKAVSDLGFQWVLPKDVEFINGELSGVISSLKPGHDFTVQVTLRALTNGNSQIHLSVNGGKRPGFRFGETAQFNTLNQPAMDEANKQLMMKTRWLAEEQRKAGKIPARQRRPKTSDDTDLKVFQ